MSDINKKIGSAIKGLRESYGLSQIALAEKINLSFQQIQKYEKGATAISVARLEQIADVFSVPMTRFLESAGPASAVREPDPQYGKATDLSAPSRLFTAEEISLLKSFRKIENSKVRQGIVQQVKGLAELSKK